MLSQFDKVYKSCPDDLIQAKLFARIAVAFHPLNPSNCIQHRDVSYCLLAKDLGATQNKLHAVIAARADEKAAAVSSVLLEVTSRRESRLGV